MSRNRDLAKNTLIIFIGTICTKLISFLLLPLYTGLLTTTEYGTVDLLNTLISLVAPIIGLQISQGLFRYLIDNRSNEKEKKELISTNIVFISTNVLIYLVLFIFISPFIHNKYKYFLATNLIASVFCDLFLQISRGLGNNKEYSIAGIITATTTIICNIIFLVLLKFKVEGMLLSYLIGYIIGVIYILVKLKIYKYISIYNCKKTVLKKVLKYSLPLVPNQLSWWVFGVSDRVIVSIILGLSYTGLLSVSYKFSNAYIILYNAFNMSWTESMALHIKDDDVEDYFNKTFNMIFNFFLSLGILIITFMPIIFKVLVNVRYRDASLLIPIAMLATICQVVVGLISVIYVSKNDTKAIANTSIFAALVNVITHLLLIKIIGLYAAVVSTFISYFVFAIYRTYDVSKKYIKVKFEKKFLFLSLCFLALVLFVYYDGNNVLKISFMILSLIYAFFANRYSFKSIINMIKKSKKEK